MSIVSDTLIMHWSQGRKTKSTPSGWLSGNAPCCVHNGQSADTRARGGIITSGDQLSFSCFNCGFKASWQPGRPLSHKLRKLLQWLNASDQEINQLALDVMRINEGVEVATREIELPTFDTVELPEGAVKILEIQDFNKFGISVMEYMSHRNLQLTDTDYYWSSKLSYRDRLIVPFYYQSRIVGWTARVITTDTNPRYLTESQPGFVYGLDQQHFDKAFTIVCEGQFDAIHVEGCALGGSEINDVHAQLLDKLNRDIIVVPDRDYKGSKLVEMAIDRDWKVSLPEWHYSCNDISDAVARYGRLYTLYSIATAAEYSPLKIRLRAKKWFKIH